MFLTPTSTLRSARRPFAWLLAAASFLIAPIVAAEDDAKAERGAEIREAILASDVEQVRQLIEQDPTLVTATGEEDLFLLHLAIGRDDPQIWPLVNVEGRINQINSAGLPPSFLAIMNSNTAALEYVLDNGGDVAFKKRFNGVTPLHWAAEMGTAEHVQLLLEHGADPDAKNLAGSTPLLVAAKFGKTEIAVALLEGKADPSSANAVGLTPLIFAAQRGHGEIVKALLKAGADPAHQDRRGKTAADYASERGRDEILKILAPGS